MRRVGKSVFGEHVGNSRSSFVLACSALALALCACGGGGGSSENGGEGGEGGEIKIVDSTAKPLALSSKKGCRIDTDCVDGLFCFHGACVKECDAANKCAIGTCGSNGRCLKQSGSKKLRDRSSLDAVADNMIPDVKFLKKPDGKLDVLAAQETVETTLETLEDYGPILYRVEAEGANANEAASAVAVETPVENGKKKYVYTFVIPATKSAMGDKGEVESVALITSAGTFNIDLLPHPEASGAYEGAVVANQFGGGAIPFRAAVEVTPKNPKKFDDIKSIKLYLPVSGNDIYSPETVEDKLHWTWVNMSKTADDRNCHVKGHVCWEATFGSNNFSIDGSAIISKDTKLYRSVRVEFSDYDASFNRFEGYVNDGFKGIYREKSAADNSEIEWAEVTVEGDLLMVRTSDDDWNNANKDVREHKVQLDINRPVNEAAAARCSAEDFSKIFAGTGCTVTSIEDFNALSDADKARCTVAGADALLEDPNLTSKLIATFLESSDAAELAGKTGCTSFVEFLTACSAQEACSAGGKALCVERTDFICAADLLASLFFEKTDDLNDPANAINEGQTSVYAEAVFADMLSLMRESYLGPQFAAYQHDIDIRKQWLENVDAPRFLSSELEKFNDGLLKKWEENVLKAHFGVIAKQFSQGVIEAMARNIDNSNVKTLRESALTDYADAWQGASEALALATRRYDSLLTEDKKRLDAASNIRPKLLDLYIVGAVESKMDLDNEVTSLSASYGPGINEITNGVKSLDQSFEDLIYMRDAEIAVSRSLDPESNNNNLLKRRKAAAEKALKAADEKKTYVFDKIKNQEFNEKSITALLSNNVNNLKGEMANLCGLPAGCSSIDECEVEVETFKCGFRIDKNNNNVPTDLNSGDPNIGTAGAAILAFREALQDTRIAQADLEAQNTKVNEAQSVADSFSTAIAEVNAKRKESIAKIQANITEIKTKLTENETAALSKLEQEVTFMNEDATEAASAIEKWKEKATTRQNEQEALMEDIASYQNQSLAASFSGEVITRTFDLISEYFDYDPGDTPFSSTASQLLAAARGGYKTVGYAGWLIADSVRLSADTKANNAQLDLDKKQLEADFADALAELTDEKDALERRAEVQAALNEYEKTIASNTARIEELKLANDEIQKVLDNQAQIIYDGEQLKQLTSNVASLKADIATKQAVIEKTALAADRKLLEYLAIAQNAQLLKSQYDSAKQRLANVQNVYSTPASVFSYASDLEVVESNINSAKEKIYDYLALVEYYAVRPFVDLRRAIYLAKAPNDLNAILNKIDELVENCGSTAQQNQPEITISLREFMGITRDYSEMTVSERFRAVMSKADLPVDSLTRYTADTNVKQLLRQGNLMAGTFQIDTSSFNIGANCNAKIKTIAVRIEGDNLNKSEGAVYPNITVFYNGAATLTSCQPNMDAVVTPLGGRTKFGTQSMFSIPTEKMSPNSGLGSYTKLTSDTKFEENDFGEPNYTFDGLPIMTSYTVLIDPNMNDNTKINWDNIDDIKLKIKYSYDSLKNSSCY